MWQGDTALLDDVDAASWRPLLAVGDAVCVKQGTPDPDFPDRQLDGWTGKIIERAETFAMAQYLVQWDDNTIDGIPTDDRDRCKHEDLILDQMWLLKDDLDLLPE